MLNIYIIDKFISRKKYSRTRKELLDFQCVIVYNIVVRSNFGEIAFIIRTVLYVYQVLEKFTPTLKALYRVIQIAFVGLLIKKR